MAEGGLTAKEQIDIIMAEYAALRAETLQRATVFFAVMGIVLPILGAGIGLKSAHPKVPAEAIAGVFVGWLIFVAVHVIYSYRLANRLHQIEDEVNRLSGKRLLLWEHIYGLSRRRPIWMIW